MEKVRVKFKRIVVDSVDLRSNSFKLTFFYEENGKPAKLQKVYSMDLEVGKFANDVVTEVKGIANSRFADNEDDFLGSYVHVMMDDESETPTSERLANAMKRFKDKVRSLKTDGHNGNYMQKYNELIGLKAEL